MWLKARTHDRSQYSTLVVWLRGVKEYSVQLKGARKERSEGTLSPDFFGERGLASGTHAARSYALLKP